MYYFDFFSDSPITYILQKKSNKTKFGGFLFIIYMIIMIFISLAYILDYCVNDKYIIEYTRPYYIYSPQYLGVYDPELNDEISFKFTILNHDRQPLPEEEFTLFFHGFLVNQNEFIKCKLKNFLLKIYYNCQDKKCEQKTKSKFYYLKIEYNGFELSHQNNTFPPLQTNTNKIFKFEEKFNFDFPSNIFLNWEFMKYEEEKGVTKLLNPFQTKKDEFKSGFISSSTSILNEKNSDDDTMKLLTFVDLQKSNTYSKYKRKKIGFLDVISKVGSLFSTIRVVLLFFFKYY